MQDDIAAKDITRGDIFYVEINKKYFFMQVIHITDNLPPPYNRDYKYGYFVVVFDKTFRTLPNSIAELDMKKLYVTKYLWKKTTFYFSIWNKEPVISFDKHSTTYHYKDRYKLTFFANANISNEFEPQILYQFTMPAQTEFNDKGITVSHQPNGIGTLLWAIEEDEKKRTQKRKPIIPQYFTEWLEFIEADVIVKTDKILTIFEKECESKDVKKALKKCVVTFNKLEDKFNFITTIEAENLYEKLIELATKYGLSASDAIVIIDNNRDW